MDEGRKKPRLSAQLANVVDGTVAHYVQGITEGVYQRIAR